MAAQKVRIDTDSGNNLVDLQLNDIVISQEFDGRNVHRIHALVVSVDSESFTLIPITPNVDLTVGRNWSRVGNLVNVDRQAYINMDAEGGNSPQISMFSEIDSFNKVNSYENNRVLIGNLNEITDERFPSINGYGIVTDNFYGRGEFVLNSGDNVSDVFSGIDTRIDDVDGLLVSQGASIVANQDGLTSLAGRVTVNESGLVSQGTSISQNASSITALALRTTETENDILTNTASIGVNADQITLRATTESLNLLDDRVTTNESSITVNSDNIALRVLQSDFDNLENIVTTNGTSIIQNANDIALRATTTTVNGLGTRLDTAESSITLNSDSIDLRVTTDSFNSFASDTNDILDEKADTANLIASINVSTEGIRIQADNIEISGQTTFSAGYDPISKLATADAGDLATLDTVGNAEIDNLSITNGKIANTTITGNKIVTNTITATQIATNTITSAQVNTSNLQAALITTNYIEGLNLDFDQGTIGNWVISNNRLSQSIGSHQNSRIGMQTNESDGMGLSVGLFRDDSEIVQGSVKIVSLGQLHSLGSTSQLSNEYGFEIIDREGNHLMRVNTDAILSGWNINPTSLSSGNIIIDSAGSIRHINNFWRFNSDGSGLLANGNITWNDAGVLNVNRISAISGTIGGFNIDDSRLYASVSGSMTSIQPSSISVEANTGTGGGFALYGYNSAVATSRGVIGISGSSDGINTIASCGVLGIYNRSGGSGYAMVALSDNGNGFHCTGDATIIGDIDANEGDFDTLRRVVGRTDSATLQAINTSSGLPYDMDASQYTHFSLTTSQSADVYATISGGTLGQTVTILNRNDGENIRLINTVFNDNDITIPGGECWTLVYDNNTKTGFSSSNGNWAIASRHNHN